MRKSLAPSFRGTIGSITQTSANYSREAADANKPIRSTENILNLITKVNVSKPLDSEKKETIKEAKSNSDNTVVVAEECKTFSIVYGKQSKKKHKTWEGDGALKIGTKTITVLDEDQKVIGTLAFSKRNEIIEGARFYVGSKEIEIVEEVSSQTELKRKAEPSTSVTVKRPRNSLGKTHQLAQHAGERLVLPEPSTEHQWNFSHGHSVSAVAVEPWLARKLRPHQSIGICFMYECIMGFKAPHISGAILADEMGLGKTLQCIALIWTLLRQGPYGKPAIRRVLIVTPSSLTGNWAAEFNKWLGRERLTPFVVDSKNKPINQHSNDKVVIISYEMLLRHSGTIGDDFDLLICDEAHRLKNAGTKVSRALLDLCSSMRILLTGTPIQNDLQEFFALVDFANPNCVGSSTSFKKQYEDVIVAARQPDASNEIQVVGEERASELNQITNQFVLRRTRAHLDSYLPGKHEVVVFCRPAPLQRQIYNSLIDSLGDLSSGLVGSVHLSVISSLRKVSSHPGLLWKDAPDTSEMGMFVGTGLKPSDIDATSPKLSGKLFIVSHLLSELWKSQPHERIVLVSSFTQTLDLLETVCLQNSYPTIRLDGSTPAAQRTGIVERFNQDTSQFVFLLSAKAGGVGLNLTGASRLVLFDSDWNPATDLQAMARIWRDGQKRNVYIYRLLTVGTIDEKMFQRQLSKQILAGGIIDTASTSSVQLSRDELRDIFSPCEYISDCLTHSSLSCPCDSSGGIPQPAETKENRSCQLQVPGGQTLSGLARMEELMSWEHHGPPFNDSLVQKVHLTGCGNVLQYMFSTSC